MAASVVTSLSLAGCSGSADQESPETSSSTDNTETSVSTDDTGTETQENENLAPTLDEFEYPAGASQDGINSGELLSSHQSQLTDAGSATLTGEIDKTTDNFEETIKLTKELGTDAIATTREDVGDGRTESMWSPAAEEVAYVQMESGFNKNYRIDNQGPQPNEVAEFRRFGNLLSGANWSEATEVTEVADESYAVTYESTGIANEELLLRLTFGDQIAEFEATITITESGYVREIAYDVTANRDNGRRREDVTMTINGVGETTVEESEWVGTSREQGIQFSVNMTEDGTALELEMVNGDEVASDASVSLSDQRGRGETRLSDPITVGDRIFLGLSESNDLLVGNNGPPDGGRKLSSSLRATIRDSGFTLFIEERRV